MTRSQYRQEIHKRFLLPRKSEKRKNWKVLAHITVVNYGLWVTSRRFPFVLINVLKCTTRASLRKLPSDRINREVCQTGRIDKIGHEERARREERKFDLESTYSHCRRHGRIGTVAYAMWYVYPNTIFTCRWSLREQYNTPKDWPHDVPATQNKPTRASNQN